MIPAAQPGAEMPVLTERDPQSAAWWAEPWVEKNGQLRAVRVTVPMSMRSFPKYTPPNGSALFVAVWGLCCCTGFLSLQQAGAPLQLQCPGFSLPWPLSLQSTGSRPQAQELVTPRHVGSSRTGRRTHVSCVGRRVLYH